MASWTNDKYVLIVRLAIQFTCLSLSYPFPRKQEVDRFAIRAKGKKLRLSIRPIPMLNMT